RRRPTKHVRRIQRVVRDGCAHQPSHRSPLECIIGRRQPAEQEVLPVPSFPSAHTGRLRKVHLLIMRRLFLALALLLAVPRIADAHTTLVRSTPKAGAKLTAFPRQISLVFSEEIEAKLGRVVIRSATGEVTNVAVHADPHDVNALIGSVDTLANGAYTLDWRVVSADGHPVAGKFSFTVAAEGAPAVAPTPPVVKDTELVLKDTALVQEEKLEVSFPILAAALRGLGAAALLTLV